MTSNNFFHPTPEDLFNFHQRLLSPEEQSRIESHVSHCEYCLGEISSLIRNATDPPTLEEEQALKRMETISQAEQVQKILQYAGLKAPRKRHFAQVFEVVSKRLTELPLAARALALTAAATLLFVAASQFWPHSEALNFQIERDALAESNKIPTDAAARFVGFAPIISDITMAMAPPASDSLPISENQTMTTQKNALLRKLQNQVQDSPDSLSALRMIMIISVLEADFPTARQTAKRLFASREKLDAETLNDLAAAYAALENPSKSKALFQLAHQKNPESPSILYSLALLAYYEGNRQEAISLMQRSLELEKNNLWKRVCENHLDEWEWAGK